MTFLASTGDSGSPGGYPAYSPNVVAVGGTTLTLNADNTYDSESGWSGSGGGKSSYETEPSLPRVGANQRRAGDARRVLRRRSQHRRGRLRFLRLSAAAAPGCRSAAPASRPPAGRAWSPSPTNSAPPRASAYAGRSSRRPCPPLYAIDAADFHDITSGSNGGYSAGPGYDMVTGLGTPVANMLVPDSRPVSRRHRCQPRYDRESRGFDQPRAVLAADHLCRYRGHGIGVGTPVLRARSRSWMGARPSAPELFRGMALFTDSSLALGSHTITAVYGGDATFTGSTSSPLAEVVAALATTISFEPFGELDHLRPAGDPDGRRQSP